ncbi:hypothetical protein A2U01_0037712, partial [Trifolium medium]|nr:hypothetical protein [Trifolium medium]
PVKGSNEGRDADSSSSEEDEGDFPVMEEEEVEEVVAEREGDDGGQPLLALTNVVNTNDSLSNGYGIVSPGSDGREVFKASSNNVNEVENLNSSNSKVGESLGEDLNALVVAECYVNSHLGSSNGPRQSVCHCSLSSNDVGGRKERFRRGWS